MKKPKIIGIVLAALSVACIAAFGVLYVAGFRVYGVPGVSMQPTIQKDERVFGRLSENYREHIQRFDLVIFHAPTKEPEIYAKRVIGLPGEHITIGASGVWINGQLLSLPASVSMTGLGVKPCDFAIPDDAVFVMGDYTLSSFDSRYYGPVLKRNVIGRLFFKR